MSQKSTVAQIRARFDNDVERFSNLQTGQSATVDAPLVLDLVTSTAAAVCPQATAVLDLGCGAGNYTLKMLQKRPHLDVTLVDLSRPMLDRAVTRIRPQTDGTVTAHQADIRELALPEQAHDIVLAAAVLHHLRTPAEWQAVFTKLWTTLRPGGWLFISDLVSHSEPAVQQMMWLRYGQYLTEMVDEAYRDKVFAYIAQEDSPRPILFQIDMMRAAGFSSIEILHKNSCFAAFGGRRPTKN